MFNLMEMLSSLTGGKDPNQAVLDANGAIPQSAPPPQAAMPPIPSTPVGARTPVTNPQPTASAPTITQSPPDLANMYAKLMAVNEKNQNAAALDSGLTLIAAGLSPNLATRQSLIHSATSGGGGKQQFSAADIVNMHKTQTEQQNALIRRNALPALMKQYNMTDPQIKALEASGKLDEVLSALTTRSLTHVTDANGQIHFVDDRAEGGKGRIITTVGSEKKPQTQLADTPGGKQLINMETGEKIGAALGPTEANVDARGVKYPGLDTGFDYERDEKGFVKVPESGIPKAVPMPGTKAEQEIIDKQQKKVETKMQAASAVASVGQAIDQATKAMDEAIIPGSTGLGSKLYNVTVGQLGGTAGNVIRDNIDTIKANASFAKLQAMRDASPTGGALGTVSDFENRLLSSAVASLSPNLEAGQLKENMFRVKATMELLANKEYKDEKTFADDVKKRVDELKTESAPKDAKVTVKRREQPK